MDRILLAVDGSKHSWRAANLAGELSKHFDAPVDVINVVSDSALVSPSGAFQEYAQLENVYLTQRDLLVAAGADVIKEAAARVADSGGHIASTEVLVGSPANTISASAETLGADCIVMGRRGLGDLRGLLMGSVSHRVGHLSDVTLVTAS